ncbi:hypothetical protein PALU110988_20535 [Paenibacillus lupini]|nr:hypothetical protein [Paenibacillus lupini]
MKVITLVYDSSYKEKLMTAGSCQEEYEDRIN